MAKIYLIGSEKNDSKFLAVKNAFPDIWIDIVLSKQKESRSLFNAEIIARIESLLAEKEVKGPNRVVCIEGGFLKMDGHYYMTDICGIKDRDGLRFGAGYRIEISKDMYECAKSGRFLKQIIQNIYRSSENLSVVSFLTNNKINRADSLDRAVKNAQNAEVGKLRIKKDIINESNSKNFQRLDEACKILNRSK